MIFVAAIFLFFVSTSQAQEIAIIDQVVNVDFTPTKAQLLINGSEDNFKKAEIIPLNEKEFLVFALVSKKTLTNKTYYSFLLSDKNRQLLSTQFSSIKDINEVNSYKQKLDVKNVNYKIRLTELLALRDALKKEDKILEAELSDKIDLPNILQLKSELESLNNSLEFFTSTKDSLVQLLESRKNRREPRDIAANSKILSEHLSDAAKVTAAAERLSRKKKETALTKFKQQIKAIEEMQQADLSSMAKQLIDLRNARKKLENSGSVEVQNQF